VHRPGINFGEGYPGLGLGKGGGIGKRRERDCGWGRGIRKNLWRGEWEREFGNCAFSEDDQEGGRAENSVLGNFRVRPVQESEDLCYVVEGSGEAVYFPEEFTVEIEVAWERLDNAAKLPGFGQLRDFRRKAMKDFSLCFRKFATPPPSGRVVDSPRCFLLVHGMLLFPVSLHAR
jgi:hypothetical protein